MRVHKPVAPIVDRLGHRDEALARGFLGLDRNGVFEIAQHHVDLLASSGTLARSLSRCGGTKWIMRSSRTGNSRSGAGAPMARGAKNWRGSFTVVLPKRLLPFRGMQGPRQVGAAGHLWRSAKPSMQPLSGLFVLDFTTLLPGPLASLMLAEAGAEVIKIERPGGENARRFPPLIDDESAAFAMLNRGKQSLALDLKNKADRDRLIPLIKRADILIEQFRPGVMARLGLGYDEVRAINPRLIYCSISGYGQSGPRVHEAGHDINYIGNTGLLDLQPGPVDRPVVPPGLIADIAGGSFPAVINILLALRARDQSGQGCSHRHRHDRRHVHLWLGRAGDRRGHGQFSQARGDVAGRRLAALSDLSGQGRQTRRVRRHRAEVLGGVHPGDRASRGLHRRPARSESDARCGGQNDLGAHIGRMASDLCRGRLLHDGPGRAWKTRCAIRISSSAGFSITKSRAHRAKPFRRCRCRSRRSFAASPVQRRRQSWTRATSPRISRGCLAAGATPSRMTARRSGPMRSIM